MKRKKRAKSKIAGRFPHPQRANDCIAAQAGRVPAELEMLFDEFWREGEMALMFGASGTGKSILAVQVAEALARGHALDGFRMPMRRHKVLYVDLDSSAKRFSGRYRLPSTDGVSDPQAYRFAENFYRGTPPSLPKMIEWLREMVRLRGFRVVIIDSLASVRTATDGTKGSLETMRELRKLTHEMDVSMLVIADADQQSRGGIASEADLRRSRILCSAAESVFAVGFHPRVSGKRYIVQTRSKNSSIVWTEHNAPIAHIERQGSGMLAFAFDDRFMATIDDATRDLINRIKTLRDEGKTFTQVAELLEITRSRVVRLSKKWQPEIKSGSSIVDRESSEADDENDEDDYDEQTYLRDCGINTSTADGSMPNANGLDISNIPFGAGMGRKCVYDLELRFDSYGRATYIESAFHHDGKPIVWYRIDKNNELLRHERRLFGIFVNRVGQAPYLPRQ